MFATFNLEELYPTYRNAKIEIDKMNLQQIFYGAPGTGKSKTIKDKTEIAEKENRVFRTTFHPDSDYSTFVGCYKPGMKSGDRIYSAEELAVKLKEIKNSGVTYPCHKFAAQYWRSLKDLSADVIKQILNACGFTESMNVEVSKGVAIGQEYLNNDEDGKIVYTFTPQAFTNAYIKAWQTKEPVFLIIEIRFFAHSEIVVSLTELFKNVIEPLRLVRSALSLPFGHIFIQRLVEIVNNDVFKGILHQSSFCVSVCVQSVHIKCGKHAAFVIVVKFVF
jgi:hypothetical protein